MTFKVPEAYRVVRGEYGTSKAAGCNGFFRIPTLRQDNRALLVCASDGLGWEHVSVSLPDRCPTWGEMCRIKGLFWDDTECVVQFHPPVSEHVNNHQFCLHLWRKQGFDFPLPDSIMVGNNDLGVLA